MTHCSEMGDDKNTPTAPKRICLPKLSAQAQSLGFSMKKASFGVCSPWKCTYKYKSDVDLIHNIFWISGLRIKKIIIGCQLLLLCKIATKIKRLEARVKKHMLHGKPGLKNLYLWHFDTSWMIPLNFVHFKNTPSCSIKMQR